MQAVTIRGHGGPEVVRVENVSPPSPGPGEVVLDVKAASLNHLDVWVRKAGRIVICGVTTGAEAATPLNLLYWNQISVFGSTMGSDEDLRRMLRAVETARLAPVVDTTFPLGRTDEALTRMEDAEQFGKIVLTIGA